VNNTVEYHKNGNVKKEFKLIDGKLDGFFYVWDDLGVMTHSSLWVNGIRVTNAYSVNGEGNRGLIPCGFNPSIN